MKQLRKLDLTKLPLPACWDSLGNYAYIESCEKYIIVNTDCIHWILNPGDPMVFHGLKKIPGDPRHLQHGTLEVTHAALKGILTDPVDMTKWVNSFGVKFRIWHNYNLLQDNCSRFGINLLFPEWRRK